MNDLLQEFCDSRGVKMRVDRHAGVIRGVKILGLHSRNGRQYPAETLARAAPLYEEAKVNVNHPKGSPLAPRDYQERIGVIRGVEVRAGEGLFGDLHFNPKHLLAEQLIWDAEHAPENVGFSHNVQARTARRDELLVVEEITRVHGVDLVADPATTRGLYEQDRSPAADGDPLSTLTLERLRAKRADLVEALLHEHALAAAAAQAGPGHDAELLRLRTELERLKLEQSAATLDHSIAEELLAAGVPNPMVTDLFRAQLRAAATADARRQLILERLQVARALGAGRPTSRDQQLVESANLPWLPVDSKGFARRISA